MTRNFSKKYSLGIRIALSFYILSVLFQLMHWKAGAELGLIPAIVVTLLYLLRYQAKANKEKLDHTKLFMVLIWFASVTLAFEVPHLKSIFNLSWLALALVVLYMLYQQKSLVQLVQQNLVAVSSFPIISIALLFKILHWPFAAMLLVTGFSLLALGVVLDWFRNRKAAKQD